MTFLSEGKRLISLGVHSQVGFIDADPVSSRLHRHSGPWPEPTAVLVRGARDVELSPGGRRGYDRRHHGLASLEGVGGHEEAAAHGRLPGGHARGGGDDDEGVQHSWFFTVFSLCVNE